MSMREEQKLALATAIDFTERGLALLRSAQSCEREGVDDISVSKILQVAQDHLVEGRRHATTASARDSGQRTFGFEDQTSPRR